VCFICFFRLFQIDEVCKNLTTQVVEIRQSVNDGFYTIDDDRRILIENEILKKRKDLREYFEYRGVEFSGVCIFLLFLGYSIGYG